eukprot:SAG22_NODE_350_length_11853_cov_3.693211_4_plen_147_part_00
MWPARRPRVIINWQARGGDIGDRAGAGSATGNRRASQTLASLRGTAPRLCCGVRICSPAMRLLPLLFVLALQAPRPCGADVSSVDVFVHGEDPACPCLRIPSIAATRSTLYAFAECRPWNGDGCDPLEFERGSGPTHIACVRPACN